MKPNVWTPRVGVRERRFVTDRWERKDLTTWDGAERYDCLTVETPCRCGSRKVVQLYTGLRCRKCGHTRETT